MVSKTEGYGDPQAFLMKWVFIWLFLFTWTIPFPPRDQATFVTNCLRLLNTQQYSFLTQYFEEYFPDFKDNSDSEYVREIVTRIPFIDKKESILKTYINHAKRVSSFAYDFYGQIKFFENDYLEVIKAYKLYDQPEKYYYLGWAEKGLGNFPQAMEWFLKGAKEMKKSEIKVSLYLGLAEVAIALKNFSLARQYLRKVANDNYKKWIMYYYLYKAEDNRAYLKRIITKIKSFPSNNPHIKEFIDKEKLK